MKNKLEQFVRASSVYERLCDKIFTNLVTNLDSNSTGSLPVLKLTLAVPMLFKTFQARLFDRIGVQIGCPSYQETVKALLECDTNKDRMISREEFEEVAIRLLRFAAAHGLRSFFEIYTMGMLVGIIVAQCLMVLLAVNCASSLQWALGFVPTLGIFMPSLLLLIPGFALGPLIGVVGVLMLRNREAMLNTDKSQSSALIAPAGVAARGGGPQPGGKLPRPKGSDVLWGFLELRKGIFREKRDKLLSFFNRTSVSDADVQPLYDALVSEGLKEGQVWDGSGSGGAELPQASAEAAGRPPGELIGSGSKGAAVKRMSDSGIVAGNDARNQGSGIFGFGLKQRILTRLSPGGDQIKTLDESVQSSFSTQIKDPAPKTGSRESGRSESSNCDPSSKEVLDSSPVLADYAPNVASPSPPSISSTLKDLGLFKGPLARQIVARTQPPPSLPKSSLQSASPAPPANLVHEGAMQNSVADNNHADTNTCEAEEPTVVVKTLSSSKQAILSQASKPDQVLGQGPIVASSTHTVEEPLTESTMPSSAEPSRRSFQAFLPLPPDTEAIPQKGPGDQKETSRAPPLSRMMSFIDKVKEKRDEYLRSK